jgi:hypothetical protein
VNSTDFPVDMKQQIGSKLQASTWYFTLFLTLFYEQWDSQYFSFYE